MSRAAYRRWLIGFIWLTAVFRIRALFTNTFHADEALFASWARLIATWRDPLLQTQPLDKPPLLFYLQALFYTMQGEVEWAARLPNFIAFLLLTPLTAVFAHKLYRNRTTAVVAAALAALSPFLIQFSATGFTDPLLTTLIIAALTLTAVRKPAPAGLLFGLALTAKYQAILFLPLLIAIGWLHNWRRRDWVRWLTGTAPVLTAVLLWQIARGGGSLWNTQLQNYGGLRPARSWELADRFAAWTAMWRWTMGNWALTAVALALMLRLAIRDWRLPAARRPLLITRLLLIYLAGYLSFHYLFAIPVWDRYLLPILPLFLILLARALTPRAPRAARRSQRKPRESLPVRRALCGKFLPILFLLFLLPTAWQAHNGRYPIGSSPTSDQGAAAIARLLQGQPYGTVLYDHWYSWHWRCQFYDKTVYPAWFPHPAALADELRVFGSDGNPHYLPLPNSPAALPVKRAVAAAGFDLRQMTKTENGRMILYKIETKDRDSDGSD